MIGSVRSWAAIVAAGLLCLSATVVPGGMAEGQGAEAFYAWQVPGNIASPGDRVVALTFDDGPSSPYTAQILDILARKGVPATFFAVGTGAQRYPDLIRREANEGHAVQGHTFDHVDLTRLPDAGYGPEVDRTNTLISSLTARPVTCVRPPYGAVDGRVVDRLGGRGLATVLWSVDPSDYKRPGTAAIISSVVGSVTPGAIVGIHDGGGDRSQTVAALPSIIDGIRARGYGFVSVCGDGFDAPVRPRVYPFGTANGSGIADPAGSTTSNHRLLSMAATPTGRGYWLVASDGGIFGFGDAGFFGSTGGQVLNRPVVGMAATPTGRGYWLVGSDGGVFNFGDAGMYGSRAGHDDKERFFSIAATGDGRGYRLGGQHLAG